MYIWTCFIVLIFRIHPWKISFEYFVYISYKIYICLIRDIFIFSRDRLFNITKSIYEITKNFLFLKIILNNMVFKLFWRILKNLWFLKYYSIYIIENIKKIYKLKLDNLNLIFNFEYDFEFILICITFINYIS